MTDSPSDLTITRETIAGQTDIIRIEAKDGLTTLARLDIPLADFMKALMGETVLAAYSQGAGT